jgi:hypothetical protein
VNAEHPGIGAVGTTPETPPSPGAPRRRFTVLDRRVSVNQMIGPPLSAHLFSLTDDLAVVRVHTQVAEGDVSKVRKGMKASFTVAAYADGDVTFTGRVVDWRLLPASEHGAIFYTVLVEAKNQRDPATGAWRLRPGMTATVDLVRDQRDHVWKVPTAALSFQPEGDYLTDASRAKLASWQQRPDAADWKPVWVAGHDGKPWPVFVKVGGKDAQGRPALHDAQFNEALDWDPELQPRPEPGDPATYPQAIIGTPPPRGGLFNPPQIKF